jgi:hypothetical protein
VRSDNAAAHPAGPAPTMATSTVLCIANVLCGGTAAGRAPIVAVTAHATLEGPVGKAGQKRLSHDSWTAQKAAVTPAGKTPPLPELGGTVLTTDPAIALRCKVESQFGHVGASHPM